MEMQFFILGHIILLAICVGVTGLIGSIYLIVRVPKHPHPFKAVSFGAVCGGGFYVFIPLEIIYWGLHWWLIP